MTDKTYDVHRSMHGDGRDYEPGDTRTMSETDARELVELGALSLEGEPPKVRDSAVQHTFGKAEPTGHLAMTSAFGEDAKPIATPTTEASPPAVVAPGAPQRRQAPRTPLA